LLIIITTPVFANSGVDYLINQPVQEENAFDLKTLAMLVSSYKLSGNDTSELEDRLISMSDSEDLIVKGHILMATGDIGLASEIAAEQENGSWDNDIYITAFLSYALLETNTEIATASTALNYL